MGFANSSMVFKLFSNLKKYSRGITLVEIVIAIFIVAIFSLILIADFPKLQKQYALSGATYKLAQDFRRAQNLGLSAVRIEGVGGNLITVKGYGIYIDIDSSPITQYIIYADVNNTQSFDNIAAKTCDQYDPTPPQSDKGDCIIETIDVSENNQDLYIQRVSNVSGDVSVNFSPPGPVINIENLTPGNSGIEIVLGLRSDESSGRTVLVNKSGLINVQ